MAKKRNKENMNKLDGFFPITGMNFRLRKASKVMPDRKESLCLIFEEVTEKGKQVFQVFMNRQDLYEIFCDADELEAFIKKEAIKER